MCFGELPVALRWADTLLPPVVLLLLSRDHTLSHAHRYSALGGALVGLASNALATMPFGAPVAAALGVIYKRSVQVGGCVVESQVSSMECQPAPWGLPWDWICSMRAMPPT
jgi:hypothetical protein